MQSQVEGRTVRLREWRERLALSQADVAQLAGLDRATVSQIEGRRRRPRPSTLRKLARALKVKPEELYRDPFDQSESSGTAHTQGDHPTGDAE